jgi:hypothetical protein
VACARVCNIELLATLFQKRRPSGRTLSFVFSPEKFGPGKTRATRVKVRKHYLDALDELGIKEADKYGAARVHDRW